MRGLLYYAGIDPPPRASYYSAPAQGVQPPFARRLYDVVIAANICQLALTIAFLVLFLGRLKAFTAMWSFFFTPLWVSDAITSLAALIEMRRLPKEDSRTCVAGPGLLHDTISLWLLKTRDRALWTPWCGPSPTGSSTHNHRCGEGARVTLPVPRLDSQSSL
jgi:hypothetical protein